MDILSGSVYSYANTTVPTVEGNYFEIGVFNGIGFAQIARDNLDKTCYAVDPFIEDGHTILSSGVQTGGYLNNQKLNFLGNTNDLKNVVLFEMTSKQFAEQLTDEQCDAMNISVVTIDGDHHYNHVVIDFEISMRLIGKKTGYIIADDTDVEGVSRAYNEFVEKFQHRIDQEVDVGGATKVLIIKELI